MPRLQQSTLPSRSNDRERDENHTLRPPSFLPPSSNYLHTRRPSWTPSLPEIPTDRDRERENLFMSSSYSQQPQPRPRPRKRRVEDISSFSPLERNPNTSATTSAGSFNFNFANPSPAINFFRRGSIVPGVVPENVERPRKRIISADAFAENQRVLPDVAHVEPASPEDGSNLRRSLQIDMKGLVGDAVGNMSISPSSRDIVLAARRGLFILDLESPLEVPRFLPQGGTWDVADVQWNPHPQRDQYIVSTSSEKLLIWNLLLVGKTSIEHILKSHYRAITDINWHTTEYDTVASTGIDSWIYAWDLREPRRPIFGLSAFKAGGTQVKWNRKDANILASSHANEVLIWDRRKGSLPISRITAHTAKIYGIDWSPNIRNELVTCSLDKTIKTWDVTDCADMNGIFEPKWVIKTRCPVWRALNLPFGQGLLSLPQRGETMLGMYTRGGEGSPVEVFEGHTDVVKEFVWRKGGPDEFQLITWSKDRTLRFWPVDNDTLQKVGHTPEPTRGRSRLSKTRLPLITYRNPPETQTTTPALSHPAGNRAILAEIRAPLPPHRDRPTSTTTTTTTTFSANPVVQPHIGSASRGYHLESLYMQSRGAATSPRGPGSGLSVNMGMSIPHSPRVVVGSMPSRPTSVGTTVTAATAITTATAETGRSGGTMSRGNAGGKSVARMDAFTWLSNVKVGTRRENSLGGGSGGGDSTGGGGASRVASVSRVPSGLDLDLGSPVQEPPGGISQTQNPNQSQSHEGGKKRRSISRSRASDDRREGENHPLQDEITSVLTKLASSNIKLEKHDLAKKRTCTLGLHGPWGERSSVFIRITFTFPREYPQAVHPEGTPGIDLERSPLISMQNRAFMLKRLKAIRERRRPCLEACLLFLLYGDEEGPGGQPSLMDGESSDEDELPNKSKRPKEVTTLLRNHKNLAEPRATQGMFGPNGEFIYFFRAPPRLVRQVARTAGVVKPGELPPRQHHSHQQEDEDDQPPETPKPRVFSSPFRLSDAVRRLALVSTDRNYVPDPRRQRSNDVVRVMTDLLSFPQRGGDSTQQYRNQASQAASQVAMIQVHRSMMFATNVNWLAGPDKKVATEYIFEADTLAEVCEKNAEVAREYGRFDHERVWKALQILLQSATPEGKWPNVACERLAKQMFIKMYEIFARNKDLQMLAMLSVLVLQTPYTVPAAPPPPPPLLQRPSINILPSSLRSPRASAFDYYTITQGLNQQPLSPALGHHSSPIAPVLAPSTSSRGSWTNIFNTGRQFVQDTFNPAPMDLMIQTDRNSFSPKSDKLRVPDSPVMTNTNHRKRKDSQLGVTSSMSNSNAITSKSWADPVAPHRKSVSSGSGSGPGSGVSPPPGGATGSGGGKKAPGLRWTDSNQSGVSGVSGISEKQAVVFDAPEKQDEAKSMFTDDLIRQFVAHVHVYAELLLRWQMYEKRIHLLKAVNKRNHVKEENKGVHDQIGIVQTCTHCGQPLRDKSLECHVCHVPKTMSLCSICRLPVKGLSRNCLHCHHVSHISCWNTLEAPICPTGCGCLCTGFPFPNQGSNLTRPPTRLAFSPPPPTALILS